MSGTPWGISSTPWGIFSTPWGIFSTPWGISSTPWEYPVPLGEYPVPLGEYPVSLGRFPVLLGEYLVFFGGWGKKKRSPWKEEAMGKVLKSVAFPTPTQKKGLSINGLTDKTLKQHETWHYPTDGVSLAVRNVFDFDVWSADARDTVIKTLQQHGLPIDTTDSSTRLATKISLGEAQYVGRWRVQHSDSRPVGVRTERISYKSPVYVRTTKTDLPAREARANIFTELHSYYHLPLPDSALITDLMTSSQRPLNDQLDNGPKTRMTDTMTVLNGPVNTDPTLQTYGRDDTKASGRINAGVSATVEALKDPFGTSKLQATVHVATVAPLTLHTLMPSDSLTRPLLTLSLHSVLPNLGGSHQPRLRLWKGVGGMVGLYEELTNTVLLADPHNGEVLQLNKNSFLERIKLPLRQLTQQHVSNGCSASGDALFVYTRVQNSAVVVDPTKGSIDTLQLPVAVDSVISDGRGGWILKDDVGSHWLIGGENGLESLTPFQLDRKVGSEFRKITYVNDVVLDNALDLNTSIDDIIHDSDVGQSTQQEAGMLFSSDKTQAALMPGFPHDESGGVYAWFRKEEPKNKRQKLSQFDSISHTRSVSPVSDTGRNCVVLPSSGQIVQTINQLPPTAPDVLKSVPASGYLEVTDVADKVVSYLPVPRVEEYSEYWEWTVGRLAPKLMLAGDEQGGLVSVDKVGGLRVWQVGGQELKAGIAEWESMVGEGETGRLELERSGGDMSLNAPKHGKLDAKNAPHVGGNTWAGGTGGRDTAGLGGVGGPYRLDAGHDVHQVSDDVKAAVPPEIKEAARKMAQAAHAKRLKEIQMSEYDHEQYEAVSSNVRSQVNQMRAVLSSLTAKAGERWWVRRRPDGELDDNALVDGLAGATNIYRQRREIPPEAGQPQTKPKRLRLLLDASGSMYRFNGLDQRLQRSLEAALMLMEACKGHESRLVYDVYAHSGEDHSVTLSRLGNPPDNNKKRLDLLRTVLAHSQFCMSGDSTVMATKNAVDKLAQTADDYDQNFVVLLSDANLDRYGISPARLATAMTGQATVQCYVVFIGSLGNQAKKLANALPAGRAYVCMDTHELPQILQHIFTHAMTQ
ncbi:von Willebrand factor type A [Trinorchestia longiramus]|nr:von Willebrand factor type A [Trinorchestia longiramus]